MTAALFVHALHQLAATVPTAIPIPTPTAPPGPVADIFQAVMNFLAWTVVAVAGVAVVASGIFLAAGGATSRPHLRETGFRALGGGFLGVFVGATAVYALNTFAAIN